MWLVVVPLVVGPAISRAEDGQSIDLSGLDRVVVHPDTVLLTGHRERQRLVVTGMTATGEDGPPVGPGGDWHVFEAVPAGVVEVTADGENDRATERDHGGASGGR
ncbi:MAG: hypothetical protein CM1200mP2_02820 [Planctomycetaceae bacterium]|nr:MAG: hypothetical protein CM1200mP2_02820 [Planctomycetaceae bacterium]